MYTLKSDVCLRHFTLYILCDILTSKYCECKIGPLRFLFYPPLYVVVLTCLRMA
jgi:hypothetical protein